MVLPGILNFYVLLNVGVSSVISNMIYFGAGTGGARSSRPPFAKFAQ
jgi:hypothetical protein